MLELDEAVLHSNHAKARTITALLWMQSVARQVQPPRQLPTLTQTDESATS